MKSKITAIIESILMIVFGILIAIYGGGAALDTYIAIVCVAGGVVLGVLALVALTQTKILDFSLVFGSAALITIAIAVFTNWLSFSVLITLLVFLLMGLGVALLLYGIYSCVKGFVFNGVGQIVVGALLVTFTALYLGVEGFRQAFWIIIGILIALYGVLFLITVLTQKVTIKKK